MKNQISRRSFIQSLGMMFGLGMSPDILNSLDYYNPVLLDQTTSGTRMPTCLIGVGGAGINAIDYMIDAKLSGVKFIAINKDLKCLERSKAETKIQIGGDAAFENIQTIKEAICGSHRVFIITGLGGETGTMAAPVIAEICHKMNILTIAVVSKPFAFEGRKRMIRAEMGLKALLAAVDAVVIIPNDCIRSLVNKEAKISEMLTKVDEIIYRSVSDIMLSGFSCMDFANIKSKSSKTGMVNLSGVRGDNLKFTSCVLLTLEEITEATI